MYSIRPKLGGWRLVKYKYWYLNENTNRRTKGNPSRAAFCKYSWYMYVIEKCAQLPLLCAMGYFNYPLNKGFAPLAG